MVGSGFSRCAIKVNPGVSDPPLWRDLAIAMLSALYPSTDEREKSDSSTDISTALDTLSLAQEYATAFGRTALYGLVQRHIRDSDFKPGRLHTQLLRLPWRDVFTTNWDTLLERTRSKVANRSYSVVQRVGQLPLARSPRIIKLHGSLPSHFPLIFTEEDYRTYPNDYAAFVNTVQQAMMETVLCLIGFSGSDPNFLHWSGWVRDNLGSSAPKIYLAGWLELSPHRRRMLEDRGVVPIDLAGHPNAMQWPEHLCHSYAVEWVLHSLERGRPYDVRDWPSLSSQLSVPVPVHLRPVDESSTKRPRKEAAADTHIDSQNLHERTSATLRAWRHNREIYPGWVVLPSGQGWHDILRRTDSWEPHVLASLTSLTSPERLFALRELVWRREALLQPISSSLESAAQDVVNSIDCRDRTVDGVNESKLDWIAVREAWRSVALSLITAARFRLDTESFDRRLKAVEPYAHDHPDVPQRVFHERCLWAINSMDSETVDSTLNQWSVEDCDPIWAIRKAALLREIDRHDEAGELVETALEQIRSIEDDELSLAGASREGWALLSDLGIDNRQQRQMRSEELAASRSNAFDELDIVGRGLIDGEDSTEAPEFDLVHRQEFKIQFQQAQSTNPMYRVIRLSEVAGLPPHVQRSGSAGMSISLQHLKLAAERLADTQPEMAMRLVLRLCRYDRDKTLGRVLTRTRVAVLPEHAATELGRICIRMAKYELQRSALYGYRFQGLSIERIRVALEVLSRVVLRTNEDLAESALEIGLDCSGIPQVAGHAWLTKPLENILKRSWQRLPRSHRIERSLDLLGNPVGSARERDPVTVHQNFDPGSLVDKGDLPETRTEDFDNKWRRIVEQVVQGLDGDESARASASLRLIPLIGSGLLREEENCLIAEALWSEKYTKPTGLPGATQLQDWAFLVFPQPSSEMAESRFRETWLSQDRQDLSRRRTAPSRVILEVGLAVARLRSYEATLELSRTDGQFLANVIQDWSRVPHLQAPDNPLQGMEYFAQRMKDPPLEPTLEALSALLEELSLDEEILTGVYRKARSMTETGDAGFELVSGLVKGMPNRARELSLWLRMGLASDEIVTNRSAISGLYSWLSGSATRRKGVTSPTPSADLVREVGFMVASRRSGALAAAMDLLRWLFDEGDDDNRNAVLEDCVHGLSYMAEELRYERHREGWNVPLLRLRCAELAQSMSTAGFADEPAVARWLELASTDPLPDVRFSLSR